MKSKGQQLIEKGIQLGDMSLIKMGNDLLKEEQKTGQLDQPRSSGPVRFTGNKFKDTMTEALEDTKAAQSKRNKKNKGKTLYGVPPVSRNDRPGVVKFKCSDCNKEEYVDPILLKKDLDSNKMYYVCDPCLNKRREKAK